MNHRDDHTDDGPDLAELFAYLFMRELRRAVEADHV